VKCGAEAVKFNAEAEYLVLNIAEAAALRKGLGVLADFSLPASAAAREVIK
jgi:hypothetical protein